MDLTPIFHSNSEDNDQDKDEEQTNLVKVSSSDLEHISQSRSLTAFFTTPVQASRFLVTTTLHFRLNGAPAEVGGISYGDFRP